MAINSKSEEEMNEWRLKLKKELDEIYPTLSKYSFRQLHYHLPDNTSFLRMHRPQKFGDNLTGIRKTIELVNKNQKPVYGFEEGRIFNGYRFVFPLFYKLKHVGSVEISINLNAVGKIMHRIDKAEWALLLSKEVVLKKVFKSELDNYFEFHLSSNWFMDEQVVSDNFIEMLKYVSGKLNISSFNDTLLLSDINVSVFKYKKDQWCNVVSYPIKNVEDKSVAILLSLNNDSGFDVFQKDFYTQLIILFIVLIITYYLAFLYLKNRKKLIEQRKFLPVCASCHKIRHKESSPLDQKSWVTIEEYFNEHEQIDFSHGICPECAEKRYGISKEELLQFGD